MATLREYLKDHPILTIIGALAGIASIITFVESLIPRHPGNENRETMHLSDAHSIHYLARGSASHKVYFYNSPDSMTRRNAFINTNTQVIVQRVENGFGFVDFVNSRGEKSIGWLLLKDLTLEP